LVPAKSSTYHRDDMDARRAEGREVNLSAVVDPARRAGCARDLVLFGLTYFSTAHPVRWSKPLLSSELGDRHVEVAGYFQHIILHGGLQAVAAPRGFGKDTWATVALIWGILYGHIKCAVPACFKIEDSKRLIGRIKTQIEMNEWLAEDFPEVVCCVRQLERSPQRAAKQTCEGAFTRIRWGAQLRFPDMPGAASAGAWIIPGSIRASIRGLLTEDGTRPDFVCLSDPQTKGTAKSQGPEGQTDSIMEQINQDIAGLASHEEPLSCLALVTVIRENDVADQLTSRTLNPQWSGVRFGAFEAWPSDMSLWEQYHRLLSDGVRGDDRDGRQAHRFYLDNRDAMDAGAAVSWPGAYVRRQAMDGSDTEVSAIQHYMNIFWRIGERAFLTEYQNDPPKAEDSVGGLTVAHIEQRINGHPLHIVPREYVRVVRGIDIGGREIHYVTIAAMPDCTAAVVDYGIIDTGMGEDDRTDATVRRPALEHRIQETLRQLREEEEAGLYLDSEGNPVHVELTLLDCRYMREGVRRFAAEAGPKYRMIQGHGSTQARRFSRPNPDKKKRVAEHWYATRQPEGHWEWFLDVDHWKMFVHQRFLQDRGTPGALALFGDAPEMHRRYAKHITAEDWDPAKGKWIQRSKFNHYFDCTGYAFAALDMLGVRLIAGRPVVRKEAPQAGGVVVTDMRTGKTSGIRSRY